MMSCAKNKPIYGEAVILPRKKNCGGCGLLLKKNDIVMKVLGGIGMTDPIYFCQYCEPVGKDDLRLLEYEKEARRIDRNTKRLKSKT